MVKKGVTMQVSFNPAVSFRQQAPVINPQPVVQSNQVNTVPEQKVKRSGFREDISKIAKFFTTLSEMTKATFKAAGYGLLTGAVSLAGFWAFGAVPRGFKQGNALIDVFKHPVRSISKKGKVVTALATLGVAGYHLIKGKLTANQRTANVDHQLKTGHRPT